MSKEMSVILLGVAVVILPYLGVPSAWRTLLLVLAGITLIIIGVLLRAQGMVRSNRNSPHHSFVENVPAQAQDIQPAHHPMHEHKEGLTSLN